MTHTTALVLETNNLQGDGASTDRIVSGLARLLAHLTQQTHTLMALSELVITHQGFSANQRELLETSAGRTIAFVRVPEGTGYYEAKNLGFDATTADLVVFGDGDCWPDTQWLAHLFAPFASTDTIGVVAGRTTYRDDVFGAAASAIDFMYFHPGGERGLTKNFYANNVAFRRRVFADFRYLPIDGVYRGHCQLLGLRLKNAGVPIHFEPNARTTHRFPDSVRELVQLRLLRGQDTVELTPHFAQTYLPSTLRRLGTTRFAALGTLGIRWGYSLRAIGRQELRALNGVEHVACVAAMTALSLVDMAGATHRSLFRSGATAQRDREALAYHQDVDHLATARAL